MNHPKELIESWIEKIQTEGRNLSKWEFDFVESIAEQLELKGRISDRQEEIIEQIYTEKCP